MGYETEAFAIYDVMRYLFELFVGISVLEVFFFFVFVHASNSLAFTNFFNFFSTGIEG